MCVQLGDGDRTLHHKARLRGRQWGVLVSGYRRQEKPLGQRHRHRWVQQPRRRPRHGVTARFHSACSPAAGSLILESPALPVEEGRNVTLRCRGRQTSSVLPASFYKDGFFMGSSPRGEISIYGILKSDEGHYRCHISGAGDSPDSPVAVTGEPQTQALALLWWAVDVLMLVQLVPCPWWVGTFLCYMKPLWRWHARRPRTPEETWAAAAATRWVRWSSPGFQHLMKVSTNAASLGLED